MNILTNFTKKNLMLNKKRSIVTIIGIMLSTALICAVAGMVSSTQETLIQTMKNTEGDYHVCFQDVPKDALKYAQQNIGVESYFYNVSLGYANLKESKNPDKPYAYVTAYSKEALEKSAFKLQEGRMPENENEIIISKHIIQNGQMNLKVGDTLTLDIGTRQLEDGSKLNQLNPYILEENEEIVDTNTKTYTIVGIIKRPNYNIENYSSPGYTIITYLNNIENFQEVNISVTYKEPKENKEITNLIITSIKETTGKEIETIVNTDLLRFQGSLSNSSMNLLYGIATVVIIIILVSSVFVIRNSFSISVSDKIRQYGMLTSIGATKKQIRKTVLKEGLYIGMIAIPLGIICGIIAINILIIIVNLLLGDMISEELIFVYSVPIMPILLSIIVSSITIYLSCIIPARRASKISPIEAIRGNEEIKIKPRKLKTSKITKKIFGIGGVIASKNLKRNRKKYRTTVISLVVSIAIFISLSSFLEYGKKMTGAYYMDLGYNISIYGGTEELYKKVQNLEGIKTSSYSYLSSAKIDMQKYGSQYGKDLEKRRIENYEEIRKLNSEIIENQNPETEKGYQMNISIVMLNNEYFKKFASKLGLDTSNLNNIAILEDDVMNYVDDTRKVEHYYNIKESDTITIELNNGENRQVKISKKTDIRPIGYESTYSDGGYLFVSEDFIKEKEDKHIGYMVIESKDATKLENKLNEMKKDNPDISITNYDIYVEQQNRIIILVSIFLYGFITVITLIGVTNIFNTMSTNMILRSKEFANLKSIGMTKKEFNKMIRLESIMYGLKSLLIGIPIGLIGSFFIYNSFSNAIDFGYIVPWTAIGISIIFVFVIVGLTMRYSLNKINKQNIIETIRKDNI